VTGGLLPGLQLNPDRGVALNLDTIHSNLDDITTGLPPGLELNLDRGKSLQANWQAKVAPETIVPETDDTPATALPRRWELRDGRAMLRSTNPELDDDDDNWKLVIFIRHLRDLSDKELELMKEINGLDTHVAQEAETYDAR